MVDTFKNKRNHVLKPGVLLLTIFFLFGKSFSQPAEEEQFLIDYNLEYNISENGETNVIHKTTITNIQNDVIPTTYSFSAKQLEIYDVSAQTNGKEVNPKVEKKDGETMISVTIKDYTIGKGRQNTISLNYKTKSVAVKSGEIWNIYIPKIQTFEGISRYDVKISIPKSFGNKVYISPTPEIQKDEGENFVFLFTKNNFQSTGISAAFGDHQSVNFKIKYQIKNDSILPAIKKIAFPSDIENYQIVSYKKISPNPSKIKIDGDGNVIAYYFLKPKDKLEIELVGTARLYGRQINPDSGGTFKDIPNDIVKKYTREQKYWETESKYIKQISQELKNENLNVIQNAKKVYEFVIQNLNYDYDAQSKGMVERKGAEKALLQKENYTCMEFTDLFITISRAMGIPAREVNGYAFASEGENKPISINLNGGDYLHSWAEFYDPNYGWIQIDPTWGKTSGMDYFTKTDTSHLSFVTKGLSSEHPFSAGTYRFNNNERLIETALSQTSFDEEFKPNVKIKKVFNLNPFQAIKGFMRLKVENIGNISIYEVNGKTLPIKSSTYIYVKKDTDKIDVSDLRGNKFSVFITEN